MDHFSASGPTGRPAGPPDGQPAGDRFTRQALGLMKTSGRRESRRQALGPMKKSGRRRSPKTSTRSDEGMREATNPRRQALGLIMKSWGKNYEIDLMIVKGMSFGHVGHSCAERNGKLRFCKVL